MVLHVPAPIHVDVLRAGCLLVADRVSTRSQFVVDSGASSTTYALDHAVSRLVDARGMQSTGEVATRRKVNYVEHFYT